MTVIPIEIPSPLNVDGGGDPPPSSVRKRTLSVASSILAPMHPSLSSTKRTESLPVVPRTPLQIPSNNSTLSSAQSERTRSESMAEVYRPNDNDPPPSGMHVSNGQNETDGIKKAFWTKRRVTIAKTVGVALLVSLVAVGLFFIPGGPFIALGAALTGAVGSGGSAMICIGGVAGLSGAAGGIAHWILPANIHPGPAFERASNNQQSPPSIDPQHDKPDKIEIQINNSIIPELSHLTNEDEAIDNLYKDTQRDFNLTINGKKLPKEYSAEQLKIAFLEAFPDRAKRLIAIKLAAQRSSQAVIDQWKIVTDTESQYLAASFGNESNVTITSDADGNPIIKGETDACLYDISKSRSSKPEDRCIIKRQILEYEMNLGTQILTIDLKEAR